MYENVPLGDLGVAQSSPQTQTGLFFKQTHSLWDKGVDGTTE